MIKQFIISILVLSNLFIGQAFAQRVTDPLTAESILVHIRKTTVAARANVNQYNKKQSCYYIGLIQGLVENTSPAIKSELSISANEKTKRKIEKTFTKMIKASKKLTNYCHSKVKKVTSSNIVLIRRLIKIKKSAQKLIKIMNELAPPEKTLSLGLKRATVMLNNAATLLPLKFDKIIPNSEIETQPNLFKPMACPLIGKYYAHYMILSNELNSLSENDESVFLEALELNSNDLRDMCFNMRGLSKYLRDIKQLKDIL
ncbi:MAG: hypothetical protein ACI9QD_000680 [Thermoproteota archaeon]|jgi:hypothetical protein